MKFEIWYSPNAPVAKWAVGLVDPARPGFMHTYDYRHTRKEAQDLVVKLRAAKKVIDNGKN